MRISCSKSDLLAGINIALRAVPSKSTFPILEAFLINAAEGIKIVANDNEMAIETMITGAIEEEGSIAVEARLFSEIIRKMPDNNIIIMADDRNRILIKCEDTEMVLNGKNPEEFPSLPVTEEKIKVSMSQFSLKEIIRQTIFSISTSDTMSTMKGELFEVREDVLKVVSLDGHRISMRYTKLPERYEDFKVIIPGKSLLEVSRIISGNTDEYVEMTFDSKFIKFVFDDTVVVSRLIEGKFVEVEKMISTDYETEIKINKNMLINCIDRAITLIREGEKKPVIFTIGENSMNIDLSTSLGIMNEQLPVEKEGNDQMVGFNARYIIDALKVIDDEIIEIFFLNSNAPCFIRNKEGDYMYIILPVNINR